MSSEVDKFQQPSARNTGLVTPAEQRKSRIALLAIIASVVVPVAVSTLMYFTGIGVPSHTVNRGELVRPPVGLGALVLVDKDGAGWDWRNSGPVFKLVQFIDGSQIIGLCSDQCRHWMYNARQVHTRLGKEADQVIQVLVYSGTMSAEMQQLITSEHPGAVLLSAETAQWQSLLPSDDSGIGERLYIVDRRSHLVMYYDQRHQGSDLLKDLKLLVKNVQ